MTMLPAAGWYPDPYDDQLLRYWDGAQWTQSVQPIGPPPGAAPFAPTQTPTPTWGPPSSRVGYDDVGEWLSASFQHIVDRIRALLVILLVPQALAAVAIGVPVLTLVGNLEIDPDNGSLGLGGLGAAAIALAVVGLVVGLLVSVVSWMAAADQLHGAWVGRPSSAGSSIAAGLQRLPRAIGWGLVAGLVYLLAVAVTLTLLVLANAPALATLLGLGAFVAGLWILVRLSLSPVVIAVGPSGVNPFVESWRITSNRWWATFGRLLLLGLLAAVLSFAVNVISQIVLGEPVSVTVVGDTVFVNGERIDTDSVIRLGDFLPDTGWLVGSFVLSVLGQAAQQAIQISGLVGMYLQGGGGGRRDG